MPSLRPFLKSLTLRLLLAAAFIQTLAHLIPTLTFASTAARIQRENPERATALLPPELRAALQRVMVERPEAVTELPKVNELFRKVGLEHNIPALVRLLTQPIDTGCPRHDFQLAHIRNLTRPEGCQFFVSAEEDFAVTILFPNTVTAPDTVDGIWSAYICELKGGTLHHYNLLLRDTEAP